MLELDILPDEEACMQVTQTLKSTSEGLETYMQLCEKQTALKQLVSLSTNFFIIRCG